MMIKKVLFICMALLLVVGCASKDIDYSTKNGEEIYNEALKKALDGDYKPAAKMFDEVERQHPYSALAPKSQVMAAYMQYQMNKYTDAVMTLDRFLQLHPGNTYAPYAMYLKGICFYEQISDVERDQGMTENALQTFERLILMYPDSPYAEDAKGKIRLTYNNLAGREMEIGRYYQKNRRYAAALNRFSEVVRTYPTTMHIQEALYRLVETYLALGLKDEAKRSASVLGHNYPSSKWYQKAYDLLTENGVK